MPAICTVVCSRKVGLVICRTTLPCSQSRDSFSCVTRLPDVTPKVLEAYAKALGVHSVIVLEQRVIRELSSEIEAALRFDHDGMVQGIVALRALKKHAGKGIWTEPALLDILPAPHAEPIRS